MENKIIIVIREFYYAMSSAMAIFIILEIVWPGVILAYLNINWVLILWLIVGIFILLSDNKNRVYDKGLSDKKAQ